MIHSGQLFSFIHSLSKSEKRYFRLQASVHSSKKNNKFLLLFDAMEQQPLHDKEKIRSALRHHIRHFSFTQHHLFEQLSKSLSNFYAASSIDIQLRNSLNSVEPLFRKYHYAHCHEILRRTKKTAQRYERFGILLEIIQWELKLMETEGFRDITEERLQELFREEKNISKMFRLEMDCRRIGDEFQRTYFSQMVVRTKKHEKIYRSMLHTHLLRNKNLSVSARIYLGRSVASIHCLLGNIKEALDHTHHVIALLESQPHRLAERFSDYISFLSNAAEFAIIAKKFSAAKKSLQKLVAIRHRDPRNQAQAQIYGLVIQVMFDVNTGNFIMAVRREKQAEKLLAQFHLQPIKKMHLLFMFAYAHFSLQNYVRCNYRLNEILSNKDLPTDTALGDYTRLLHLVMRYERGDADLFESVMRSTYRYLEKRRALHPFEKLFLSFLRTHTHAPAGKAAFIALKKKAAALEKDPKERMLLTFFDFVSWIGSKIEQRSFAEVVSEKVK
ncbi:MAG: hypothetical protein HY064_06395 [Bacteroidetes bacterium]|nr:hypothetical protein [Bacteroidota bacterium]